jgi:hypothetical protein
LPLEGDVLREIQNLGYTAIPHVGCSGFRVDLGVVDPQDPGRFLLGVECDGASYHATPTARDRDRLRQEVLEKLGWHLHRVWSTEWFHRRPQEIERLRAALEAAKKPAAIREDVKPAADTSVRKVEVGKPTSAADRLPGTTPYRVARLKVDKKAAKAEMHTPAGQKELQRLLVHLAKEEGPIHIDLATKRLRQAWNLSRAGDRVREAVDSAAFVCAKLGELRRQGDFLWPKDKVKMAVRVPDPKDSATAREIEQISEEELQAGLRLLLTQGGAMDSEAILAQTARLFGFGKLGDTIRQRVQASLDDLREQGACVERGGAIALRA